MSASGDARDVEHLPITKSCPLFCDNLTKPPTRSHQNLRDWAGQGCFLCLQNSKDGQFAVLIPCIKPSRHRRVIGRSTLSTKTPTLIYEEVQPWETACEPDSVLWSRIVDTCYQVQGNWKRWIPFYGITEVQEVTVRLSLQLDIVAILRLSLLCDAVQLFWWGGRRQAVPNSYGISQSAACETGVYPQD